MRTPCTTGVSDGAAAQQRPHPGEQFGEPERLGDVVVGAGVEADDGVHLVDAGGEDQHRGAVPFGTHPAGHLQAVHLGQAEVKNDQVDAPLQCPLEGLRAVGAHLNLIALPAQRTGERLGNRGVILGEKYAGHEAIVGP